MYMYTVHVHLHVYIHFVCISCRADPFFEGLVLAATAEPVLLSGPQSDDLLEDHER